MKFQSYELGGFYDEMFDSGGQVRPEASALVSRIQSLEDGELKRITDFGNRSTLIGRQVSWSGDGKFLFAALMETDADIVLLDGVLP